MGKIFVWIGIFAAIYLLIKFAGVVRRKGQIDSASHCGAEDQSPSKPEPSSDTKSLANLVTCAQCGIHLPRAEALEKSGKLFCSEDHAH